MLIGLHVKYPLFLPDLNESWIFWTDVPKTLRHQVSSTSVKSGPNYSMRKYRRTDRQCHRQTDMTKLVVAFCNFVNAPKNGFHLRGCCSSYFCSYIWCIFACKSIFFYVLFLYTFSISHTKHSVWVNDQRTVSGFHRICFQVAHYCSPCNIVDLIHLAQDRDKWPPVLNILMELLLSFTA
jgi:hypothetical protein